MIFVMFDVISGAKNDVIMDGSFINMGGNNIRIFSLYDDFHWLVISIDKGKYFIFKVML